MRIVNRGDLDGRFRHGSQGATGVDFGPTPGDDELDLVTVLLHTTALRGNRWELSIPKPFLKPGAFHLQQIQTVSSVKLEPRLGALSPAEMVVVDSALRGWGFNHVARGAVSALRGEKPERQSDVREFWE
jgi:hypothetical protein